VQNPAFRTATVVLSVLIALAWLIAAVAFPADQVALALGFIPARLSGADFPWPSLPVLLTPLSSAFVHAGALHIGFNLLIFVYCGIAVERILGRGGLITLFVVGAYAAALAQWLPDRMGVVPMIGASGAVSAVIGAYSLSFGRAKRVTSSPRLNRWINVVWLLAAWVVMQLMMGWLAGAQGFLLATPAHIGGFLAGLLLQRPLLLWRYRKA
jgi:membrane associated rhomboid family serine protease